MLKIMLHFLKIYAFHTYMTNILGCIGASISESEASQAVVEWQSCGLWSCCQRMEG